MALTLTTRNNIIRDLQCKYSTYADTVRKALQYGRRDESCRSKNLIIANKLIGAIYRYIPDSEDNCLTEAEICDVIEYSYLILDSDNPCNC